MKVWLLLAVFTSLVLACSGPELTPAPTSVPRSEDEPFDSLPHNTQSGITILDGTGPVGPLAATIEVRTVTPTATPEPSPTPIIEERPEPIIITSEKRGEGKPAHDFELALFNKETLRLSDLDGKVVVMNFWASWCPPCRWEMPDFEGMWQEYQEQGVVFLGVAVADSEEDARDFAEEVGVTYPLGFDATGKIARDYEVFSLPTTYFIDKQGNVARKLSNPANEGVLRLFLKGQLGGG